VSRPEDDEADDGGQTSFNPVLGFLSVSTYDKPIDVELGQGFNPVLGFLSVSTVSDDTLRIWLALFQSRAGFSECLDVDLPDLQRRVRRVSIPCWVF